MYSDILLPIHPALSNPSQFKTELQDFLDHRDQIIAAVNEAPITSHRRTHDASWFALLYAILACGAQCLSTIDVEAELNSKVFGMMSFFDSPYIRLMLLR